MDIQNNCPARPNRGSSILNFCCAHTIRDQDSIWSWPSSKTMKYQELGWNNLIVFANNLTPSWFQDQLSKRRWSMQQDWATWKLFCVKLYLRWLHSLDTAQWLCPSYSCRWSWPGRIQMVKSRVSLPQSSGWTNTVDKLPSGPSLVTRTSQPRDFWEYLCILGWEWEWMWERLYLDTGTAGDMPWLLEAIKNDTAIWVTYGPYDGQWAPAVSVTGWLFYCTKTERHLSCSFYEYFHKAS